MSLAMNAGGEVEVLVGTLSLKLTRMTLATMVQFERWCQSRVIEMAKASLEDLPADIQSAVMTDANERAAGCSLGTASGVAFFNSLEGRLQILYLCAKPHHPKLKPSDLAASLGPRDRDAVTRAVNLASGLDMGKSDSAGEAEKSTADGVTSIGDASL